MAIGKSIKFLDDLLVWNYLEKNVGILNESK